MVNIIHPSPSLLRRGFLHRGLFLPVAMPLRARRSWPLPVAFSCRCLSRQCRGWRGSTTFDPTWVRDIRVVLIRHAGVARLRRWCPIVHYRSYLSSWTASSAKWREGAWSRAVHRVESRREHHRWARSRVIRTRGALRLRRALSLGRRWRGLREAWSRVRTHGMVLAGW